MRTRTTASVVLASFLAAASASADFAVDVMPFPDSITMNGTAFGDWNQDGLLDLAIGQHHTGSNYNNNITLLLNDGQGGYTEDAHLPGVAWMYDLDAADFDGDGVMDLVASNFSPGNSVSVYRGLPGGGFAAYEEYSVIAIGLRVTTGDVNGDGAPDIVAALRGVGLHAVGVLMNNGDGTFAPIVTYDNNVFNPSEVRLHDLDEDGDLDIISANRGSGTITVFRNAGTGVFNTSSEVYPVTEDTVGFALIDYDNDGDLDIATASHQGPIDLLENTGGTFAESVEIGDTLFWTTAIAAVDIDHDGNNDLAITNNPRDHVQFLRNTGGAFESGAALTTGLQPNHVATRDLDGDGDEDLVISNDGLFSGEVTILKNQSVAPSPADINADGAVNAADLAMLIAAWGSGAGPCDLSGDGVVGASDLAILIAAWTF